jgi:hypothetical protein
MASYKDPGVLGHDAKMMRVSFPLFEIMYCFHSQGSSGHPHSHANSSTPTQVCAHMHICTHMCMWAHTMYTPTNKSAHKHPHAYACTNAHMHTYRHTHTCMYTHNHGEVQNFIFFTDRFFLSCPLPGIVWNDRMVSEYRTEKGVEGSAHDDRSI